MGLASVIFGRKEECQVHGGHARKANRMLYGMTAACLALIIWHVAVFGPSGSAATLGSADDSLPLQVWNEIRDLLFNGHGIVAELRDVLPYFLVGILLAGYIRTFKFAVKLQMSLRKYGKLSVVIASVVGIITPLCACGTITTAVSLLFAGLPLAPVMSLMVTSALLSPSTYLITLNDLGPEWTVIRTVSALAMGLFAGGVTLYLNSRGFEKGGLFIEGAVVPGDFHDEDYPIEHLRCNCRQKFGNRIAVRTSSKFLVFLAKSAEMLGTVGKYVLVGVIIGTIVERYMPGDWIYRFFGRQDPLNIVWITLASVPMFLHQISASSILAHIKSSLHGTLDGGAALAFMIGGPVTAIPTMVMFWTIFKKRVFALYLFVCLAGTILVASLFQWLVFVPGVDTGNHLFRNVSSVAGGQAAVISKTGTNVKIALDPAGKSVVATYTNDVEGHGGVLFDAGFGRLAAAAAGTSDDHRYVQNGAAWLEQAASSAPGKNIRLHLLSGKVAAAQRTMAEAVATSLRAGGYTVTVSDKSSVPHLTEKNLENTGQLWLLFPESALPGEMSAREVEEISGYHQRGNALLIAVEGGMGAASANALATRLGVTFSGNTASPSRIPVGMASNLFTSASELLGRFLKIVNKA